MKLMHGLRRVCHVHLALPVPKIGLRRAVRLGSSNNGYVRTFSMICQRRRMVKVKAASNA